MKGDGYRPACLIALFCLLLCGEHALPRYWGTFIRFHPIGAGDDGSSGGRVGCLLCGAPCFSEPVSVIQGPMTTRQRIILRSFISRRFQARRGGMAFPVGIVVAIILGFDAIWALFG